MKKAIRILVVAAMLAVVGSVFAVTRTNGVTAGQVGQIGNTPRCNAESIKPRGKAYEVKNNVATVEFKVTGVDGCRVEISNMSFYAPSMDGRPYDKQVKYKVTTKKLGKGTHKMSVALPAKSDKKKGCFYQVDLTYGTYVHTPVIAYGHDKVDCGEPKPQVSCVGLSKNPISRTAVRFTAEADPKNGAKIKKYIFTVTDAKTGVLVHSQPVPSSKQKESYTYRNTNPGSYRMTVKVVSSIGEHTSSACSKPFKIDAPEPGKIEVCELATKKIIQIKETQFDPAKHSKDPAACIPAPEKIFVCELATKNVIKIDESTFDPAKHSKDLNDCVTQPGEIVVCELATKNVIKITEDTFDPAKHDKDTTKCEKPTVPTKLPNTGAGAVAVLFAGVTSLSGFAHWAFSRRSL